MPTCIITGLDRLPDDVAAVLSKHGIDFALRDAADPLTGHALWAREAFPDATPETQVAKVAEEFAEFLDEPCLEEAADVALVLAYWAHLRGENLTEATHRKAAVNRARTWTRLPDGTYRHLDVERAS